MRKTAAALTSPAAVAATASVAHAGPDLGAALARRRPAAAPPCGARRGSRRPHVVQRRPRSAPSRSTSQARPPHGCGRRSSRRSPRRNGTGAVMRRARDPSAARVASRTAGCAPGSDARRPRAADTARSRRARLPVRRHEVAVGRRHVTASSGRDLDLETSAYVAWSWATSPPTRVSAPGERRRSCRSRGPRSGAPSGVFSTERAPGGPATTVARDHAHARDRRSPRRPRCGARSRGRRRRSAGTPAEQDAPARPGPTPGRCRPRSAPARGRRAAGPATSRRAPARRRSTSSWRPRSATSPRSWSLRVLRFATSSVRSCDDCVSRPVPPSGLRSCTTTSSPSRRATAARAIWLRGLAHRHGAGDGAGDAGGRA